MKYLKLCNLPNGWVWKKLGDLSISIRDGTHTPPKRVDKGVPLLSATNIKEGYIDWNENYTLISNNDYQMLSENNPIKVNDILVTIVGSIGRACVNKNNIPFTVQRSVAIIRVHENLLNPNYLSHYFNSNEFRTIINSLSYGTSQKGIYLNSIKKLMIPVPPIETQRKIVAILDRAEATRQLRSQAHLLSQKLLDNIFLDMFGDPVKNDKSWDKVKIGDISTHVSSGATPKGGSDVYQKEGIPFIRSQNIRMNEIAYEDIAYISIEIHDSMSRSKVKDGDVLLNITGASIGRVAWFKGEDNSANVNQHVCIIRPDITLILPEFLSYQISMNSFQNTIMASQSGATRQAFNYSQIKNFDIILPDMKSQKMFVKYVYKHKTTHEYQMKSWNTITSLNNSLISKAFTGELVA